MTNLLQVAWFSCSLGFCRRHNNFVFVYFWASSQSKDSNFLVKAQPFLIFQSNPEKNNPILLYETISSIFN